MKKIKIQWDKQPTVSFREAIKYIAKDSPQNAGKVKTEILVKINQLSQHPEFHPPDKYKQNNIGNYRAFELYHYRISYLVTQEEIIITRVRHTSQMPEMY